MSDAKKDMTALIKKRARKIKEIRTNSSKKMTYEDIVFKFFTDMENTYQAAQNAIDFDSLLDVACNYMKARMQSIDLAVELKITWNDAEDWKELRVTGVEITWSDNYLRVFTDQKEKTVFVNVSDILLS